MCVEIYQVNIRQVRDICFFRYRTMHISLLEVCANFFGIFSLPENFSLPPYCEHNKLISVISYTMLIVLFVDQ